MPQVLLHQGDASAGFDGDVGSHGAHRSQVGGASRSVVDLSPTIVGCRACSCDQMKALSSGRTGMYLLDAGLGCQAAAVAWLSPVKYRHLVAGAQPATTWRLSGRSSSRTAMAISGSCWSFDENCCGLPYARHDLVSLVASSQPGRPSRTTPLTRRPISLGAWDELVTPRGGRRLGRGKWPQPGMFAVPRAVAATATTSSRAV